MPIRQIRPHLGNERRLERWHEALRAPGTAAAIDRRDKTLHR